MNRFSKFFALASIALLAATTAVAHADPIGTTDTFTETPYSQSNNGECCFTVTLTQLSATEIGVDVSLSKLNSSDPTPLWANTGGPHVGFGFNTDEAVTLSNIDSPWTLGGTDNNVHMDTTANSHGVYNNTIDNKWENGTNGHKGGDLTFDLSVSSGTLNFADFVSSNDFYFEADILGNNNTGEGFILCPGTTKPPVTPEPSSLMLLGTGILGAGLLLRRRMHAQTIA